MVTRQELYFKLLQIPKRVNLLTKLNTAAVFKFQHQQLLRQIYVHFNSILKALAIITKFPHDIWNRVVPKNNWQSTENQSWSKNCGALGSLFPQKLLQGEKRKPGDERAADPWCKPSLFFVSAEVTAAEKRRWVLEGKWMRSERMGREDWRALELFHEDLVLGLSGLNWA